MRKSAITAPLLAACLFLAATSTSFARLDNTFLESYDVWGTREISSDNYTSIAPNGSVSHEVYGAKIGGGLELIRGDMSKVAISSETYVAVASEQWQGWYGQRLARDIDPGYLLYAARADGGIDFCKSTNKGAAWVVTPIEADGARVTTKYVSLATSGNGKFDTLSPADPSPDVLTGHIYAVRADGKGIDRFMYDSDTSKWSINEKIGNPDGTPHEVAYTKVVAAPRYRHWIYALRADGLVDAIWWDHESPGFSHRTLNKPNRGTYIDIAPEWDHHGQMYASRSDGGIDRFFWDGTTNGGGDEVRPKADGVYHRIAIGAYIRHSVYGARSDGLFWIYWDFALYQESKKVRWNVERINTNNYSSLTYNSQPKGMEMYGALTSAAPASSR